MQDKPHALYRFFDGEDRLLYIGITVNPGGRFGQHSDDKPWWSEIARIAMEPHPDRGAVLEAERRAIVSERPRYNKQHNKTHLAAAPAPIVGHSTVDAACDVCNQPVERDGYLILYGRELAPARRAWHAFEEEERSRQQYGMVEVNLGALLALPVAKWRCLHSRCDPQEDTGDYGIPVRRPLTAEEMLSHTLHLMGKRWLEVTDWTAFLRDRVRFPKGM